MNRVLSALAALCLLSAGAAHASEASDLYKSKCAACHGTDGKPSKMGEKMGAPDLGASKSTAAQMEQVIAAGKGKMMGFGGKLTPEQIKGVATYVKGGMK
jgi:cytochrome c6